MIDWKKVQADKQAKKRARKTHYKANLKLSGASKVAPGQLLGSQMGLRDLDHALVGLKAGKGILTDFVLLRAKYRNGGYCEVPFNGGCKNPAKVLYHIWPRSHYGTRYHPKYIIASCAGHNFREKQRRETEQLLWREYFGSSEYELMVWIGSHVHFDRGQLWNIFKRVKYVLAGGRDNEYILTETTDREEWQ